MVSFSLVFLIALSLATAGEDDHHVLTLPCPLPSSTTPEIFSMPGRTECALFRPITARLDPTTIPMRPITTSNSPFASREYRTVSPPEFGRVSVIIVGGRRVREDRWLQAAELRHRLLVPTGCAANHPVHEVGMDYGFSRSVLPTEGIYDMQMAIANHYWYQVAARLCLKGRWRSTAFRSGRRWETSTFPRSASAKWRSQGSPFFTWG